MFVLPDVFLLCTCGRADLDFECRPEGGADDRHKEGLTMGLGIPEQVIELVEGFGDQLAVVDVQARTARSTAACLRSRPHLAGGC